MKKDAFLLSVGGGQNTTSWLVEKSPVFMQYLWQGNNCIR